MAQWRSWKLLIYLSEVSDVLHLVHLLDLFLSTKIVRLALHGDNRGLLFILSFIRYLNFLLFFVPGRFGFLLDLALLSVHIQIDLREAGDRFELWPHVYDHITHSDFDLGNCKGHYNIDTLELEDEDFALV